MVLPSPLSATHSPNCALAAVFEAFTYATDFGTHPEGAVTVVDCARAGTVKPMTANPSKTPSDNALVLMLNALRRELDTAYPPPLRPPPLPVLQPPGGARSRFRSERCRGSPCHRRSG